MKSELTKRLVATLPDNKHLVMLFFNTGECMHAILPGQDRPMLIHMTIEEAASVVEGAGHQYKILPPRADGHNWETT